MKNKIIFPIRSWSDSTSDIASEVNMRGCTSAYLFINGYYYPVVFFTKEGLKWEIDNCKIFASDAGYGGGGLIAVDSLSMATITAALNAIISSSAYFKRLFPYKTIENRMMNFDIRESVKRPLELALNEFSNIH
jgi:hypothetical protein